jgi:hypothetical protein
MTEEEVLEAIRKRISDPKRRIDMTTVATPPLYEVASIKALDATEAQVGFPLPALLRRLYTEVENGGFGPGAGLVGVAGGHTDVDGRTIGPLYATLRAQRWPEGVLPLCDWGGGAWTSIEGPDERIATMDESGLTRTRFTLYSWLEAWVSGVDILTETFEMVDGIMTNPFTKKPMTVKRRGRAKGVSP